MNAIRCNTAAVLCANEPASDPPGSYHTVPLQCHQKSNGVFTASQILLLVRERVGVKEGKAMIAVRSYCICTMTWLAFPGTWHCTSSMFIMRDESSVNYASRLNEGSSEQEMKKNLIPLPSDLVEIGVKQIPGMNKNIDPTINLSTSDKIWYSWGII